MSILLQIALSVIPLGLFMHLQTRAFLKFLQDNQQVGGQPISVFKEQIAEKREEQKIRAEILKPRVKAPAELLR